VTERSEGDRVLVIHERARWLMLPDRRVVPCASHKLLRRLLLVLARARVARPGHPIGLPDLVAAGWPDERILAAAAKNRVHVALSRLRRLGLGPWLVHVGDGWLLSTEIGLEVSAAAQPPAAASHTRSC
jgi:hypothetical protein